MCSITDGDANCQVDQIKISNEEPFQLVQQKMKPTHPTRAPVQKVADTWHQHIVETGAQKDFKNNAGRNGGEVDCLKQEG